MTEEPFVFIVESVENGKTRERLMKCIERTRSAEGIVEGVLLSAREKSPVLCVVGKHLTPHKIYDRYFIVLPMDSMMLHEIQDDNETIELWDTEDFLYEIISIVDSKGYEKVIIRKIDSESFERYV